MLENIKSKCISEIIFSHVTEEIKLNLIKYNKRLQQKMKINLICYKAFKEKYITYKSKTFAKEYHGLDNQLLFEGNYLNGKINGKGKEYNIFSGNLVYEGDYLNGKRNGKGKDIILIINYNMKVNI